MKPYFETCPRCRGRGHYIRFRWVLKLPLIKRRVPCEVCHQVGKIDVQPAKCPKCGRQLKKWKIGCVLVFNPKQAKVVWMHETCAALAGFQYSHNRADCPRPAGESHV